MKQITQICLKVESPTLTTFIKSVSIINYGLFIFVLFVLTLSKISAKI